MSGPVNTQKIKILIANGREFLGTEILRQQLGRLGCDVEITVENDIAAAIRLVTGGSVPPQVLLVDLIVRHRGVKEAQGLFVIEAARGHERDTLGADRRSTLIVATWPGGGDHTELDRKAEVAGADLRVEAASLRPGSAYGGLPRLAEAIHEELVRLHLIEKGPRLELPEQPDPGLQTALSDVGEQNIRLLIGDLAAKTDTIISAELAYVTPGASGAHVLRATLAVPDGRRTWLLKLSTDRPALEREIYNSQRLIGRYRDLVVHYLPQGPARHGGWNAIATEFAHDAVTFRSWLGRPGAATGVAHVLDALFFGDGLVTHYGAPQDLPGPVAALFAFPDFRRARVRTAVADLREVLADPRGPGLAGPQVEDIVEAIEAFVREGMIGGITAGRRPGAATGIVQHGDLHGGNILVTDRETPRPCMIDLASYDIRHWAYDLARLLVDVVMHCVDLPPDCHFWEGWVSWRQTLSLVSEFGAVPADTANPGAAEALRWIVQQHARLLPHLSDDSRWQWHVAIGEHLLRAACRGLPTPKRALGLVGAYDQLMLARAAIGARPGTF